MKFTEADKNKIAQAVKEAEAATSGEIVPLIVKCSDNYPHADQAGGIIGLVLALIGCIWFLPYFDYTWLVAALTGGFVLGYLAVRFIPPLKRAVLGGKVVQIEVYQRALQAFFEQGLTGTRDRTGVLIMVSLMERRVQVLADEGINKVVPKGTWDRVVGLVLDGIGKNSLIDGLCEAIKLCGEILAKDFPIRSDDRNELADDLIVE